jgi:hypothetical protein
MLEAHFPRIPGEVGMPEPGRFRCLQGGAGRQPRARGALVAQGDDGTATKCGFLSLFQDELASASGVPVVTSAP